MQKKKIYIDWFNELPAPEQQKIRNAFKKDNLTSEDKESAYYNIRLKEKWDAAENGIKSRVLSRLQGFTTQQNINYMLGRIKYKDSEKVKHIISVIEEVASDYEKQAIEMNNTIKSI